MHSLALGILRRTNQLAQYPSDPIILDNWEQDEIYDRELATSLACTPTRAAEIRLAHDASWQTLNAASIAQAQVTQQEQQGFNAFHSARSNLYSCVLPGEVVFRCVQALQLGALQPAQLPAIDHLIVDEFQDLNACDQSFVQLLAGSGAVLFIAGDDDQSIYSFRHADPSGIVHFPATYPNSSSHILNDCFRCAPAILAGADRLITHNVQRVPKQLVALYGAATPPVNGLLHAWSFPDAGAESRAIAESCRQLIAAGMAGQEDQIVILIANRRVQLDMLTQELGNLGLPFDPPRGEGLRDTAGIRAVYAILRVLRDTANVAPDYPAHRDLLATLTGVGVATCMSVADACIANNQNFHDLFYMPVLPHWLNGRQPGAVTRVQSIAGAVANWTLADPLAQRAGDIQALLGAHVFTSGNQVAVLRGEWATLAGSLPPAMTLEECLQFLSADTEAEQQRTLETVIARGAPAPVAPAAQPTPKRIRILTMHGAKGLSGKVVFIPGAEQGIMPSFRAIQAAGLVIEARRLFYVSLTRAMACCIVSHAASHTGASAFQLQQQPVVRLARSQFLNEMAIASVNRGGGLTTQEATQIFVDLANL